MTGWQPWRFKWLYDCVVKVAQPLLRTLSTGYDSNTATYQPLEVDADGHLQVDVQSTSDGLTGLAGTIDTFGRVLTGGRVNQVDVQWFLGTPGNLESDNVVTLGETGGGSQGSRNGGAEFKTGASAPGTSYGESTGTVNYYSGAEVFVDVAAAFTTPTEANSSQRIGLFDANNGFFLGYEGLTFGVTRRSGASDTFVSSFSDDPLDGSAGSLFTRDGTPEAINYTYCNVFRIRFGWLGSAPVKFEVVAPDGHWVTFHTIKQPNTSADPHIEDPDVPIRCEVNKAGSDATDYVIYTNCWGAGTTTTPPWLPLNQNIDLSPTAIPVPLAALTRSVIAGETTAGGGALVNAKVSPSGAVQIAGDVAITDPIPAGTNNIGDVDIASTPAVEASYQTAEESGATLGTQGTTWTDLVNVGGSSLKLVEVFNDTDGTLEVSFDGGTTVHARLPPGGAISRDLKALELVETGEVSVREWTTDQITDGYAIVNTAY